MSVVTCPKFTLVNLFFRGGSMIFISSVAGFQPMQVSVNQFLPGKVHFIQLVSLSL